MEDHDLRSIAQARKLLLEAYAAAPGLVALSQESIDAIVDAIREACLPHLEAWARMAVEETGFGNAADKTAKNRFAATRVYEHIRPMRTVGVLRRDDEARVIEIGAPAGVVAAIIPSTNPTSTAINKILISLKAACPVVVSPHPRARGCVAEVVRVLAAAARAAGAPAASIGCLTEVALAGTRELMRHEKTAVILATGGTGLVRAAYSSGKPAYGVGPGNVPAYVHRSADVDKAARDIVAGKSFDHGVLCSAENAVVADSPIAATLREAMRAAGAAFLSSAEAEALARVVVTPAGGLNTDIVGRSAAVIATMAGLNVPEGTRCLVADLDAVGPAAALSREKLSPILAFYDEDGWEAGCARCLEILAYGGMGHTMSIHATDRDLIMRFALTKPVFRIVVNSPSAVGAVGLTTGLEPSMTLGCGALGGNITSDNITPRHLVNIKRLAFEISPYDLQAEVRRTAPSRPPAAPVMPPRPLPVIGSLPPRPAPGSTPVDLRRRIEAILLEKMGKASAGRAPAPRLSAAPLPAAPAARAASPPSPESFVCEADVRSAMAGSRKIVVSSRTILTPSARDLGESQRIFVKL
jgi:acetaldehyde dehydrogenase (acetylating)